MQGVINCVMADSHGFIYPPLTFQPKKSIEQNAFYYVHLTNDNDCLDPMFLISIVGCNFLQVFGAVHGERDEVLLDPLCDPVSLLHVPDDLLHGEVKVARVLEAIAGAKSELAEYYAERHSGVQPYYNCDGNLKYIKSISRNVWELVMNIHT